MVDEESQRIREEVMRALAEQEEGSVSGVDVAVPESTDASTATPQGDPNASAAGFFEDNGEVNEVDEAQVEHDVLVAVLDDVREQSSAGRLVEPTRWPLIGLVPAHQTPDDWEMLVYEYLEEHVARCEAKAAETAIAKPIRSATRAVGVPCMLRTDEDEVPTQEEESSETPQEGKSDEAVETIEGAEKSEDAPEFTDESTDASDNNLFEPVCNDIVVLVGKHSYYLYSNEHMTDTYARWSFLAAEDDRVLTFVECVREESRTYPRPMGATALTNEPFNLQPDEVAKLWETVRESGAYPDLDTVIASNGDVYYFSTEYLSPTYAASLAEWNSVERDMYL